LRKTTGTLIDDVYNKGENQLGKNKYTIPMSEYMKDEISGNVKKVNKIIRGRMKKTTTRVWNAFERI
jgi:hypothetical protein